MASFRWTKGTMFGRQENLAPSFMDKLRLRVALIGLLGPNDAASTPSVAAILLLCDWSTYRGSSKIVNSAPSVPARSISGCGKDCRLFLQPIGGVELEVSNLCALLVAVTGVELLTGSTECGEDGTTEVALCCL